MLWAGILFIWELVGINLEAAKEAGGNAGAVVKSIRSPEAVPWVLIILVGYFIFKLHIEWRQCSEARRQVREAKMDYHSAWIVSLAAITLYFGQTISQVQIVDILQSSSKAQSLVLGFFTGGIFTLGVVLLPKRFFIEIAVLKLINIKRMNVGILLMLLSVFLFLQATPRILEALGRLMRTNGLVWFHLETSWKFMLIGLVSGSISVLITSLAYNRWSRRLLETTTSLEPATTLNP